MNKKLREKYEKIKDRISEEEFLELIEKKKKEFEDIGFMKDSNDEEIAELVVSEFLEGKNEYLSDKEEFAMDKISKIEEGAENLTVKGRVMRISNPRKFVDQRGKEGKVANVLLADDTGEIRAVFWTENIPLLEKINEGDIIEIKGVEAKRGFGGRKEVHLQPRSEIKKLKAEEYPEFPEYEEKFIKIGEITGDQSEVNVMGRIVHISPIRTYKRDGKEGKMAAIKLKDDSGEIRYLLWNRDVDIINDLKLKEGDAVKILGAQVRERDDEIYLSHSGLSRIEKGDYDVPKFKPKVHKIGELHGEERDVTVIGLVTKVQDIVKFERPDGTKGAVKSIKIKDDTGSTYVKLWGEDAKLKINKGDVIKVVGGNVVFDDFTSSYCINTNWNTRIEINPENISNELSNLLKEYKNELKPKKIGTILEMDSEEGEEVDVLGRVISVSEPREFQRDDGIGIVRSVEIADETGIIRASFWDDKASEKIDIDDVLQIENARIRIGSYGVELSVGKTSRVIRKENTAVPSLEELEKKIFVTKNIKDLERDDRHIKIIGRIIDIGEIAENQREDGSIIKFRRMEIADKTGTIEVSLWDDKYNLPLDIGNVVEIYNPRVVLRNERLELRVGRSSEIKVLKDAKDIPKLEELVDLHWPKKDIKDLEPGDRNVRITGKIVEISGSRPISYRCPNCHERIDITEESVCNFCGEPIDEPEHLLVIPAKLVNDTGEIRVVFFRREAEELIEMKTEEIVEIINEVGEENALEDRIKSFEGIDVTLLGYVSADEYTGELTFIPRKIIKKEL